jgi:hypothetical protein
MEALIRKLRALATRLSGVLRRAWRRPPSRRPLAEAAPTSVARSRTPFAIEHREVPTTRPAIAAVHASVASAIGDHVAFHDFAIRHVGHLVEVSVCVGLAHKQFIVDSREDDFALRLQAKLVRAFPRAVA